VRLNEALGTTRLELSPSDFERIEAAVSARAAADPRYADFLTGELASERRVIATRAVLSGGDGYDVDAPLERIPVFVREGADNDLARVLLPNG
jgi:hypothetical protein